MAINSATAYLDNAATTAMVPEAVLAMSQQLGIVGNASSLHAAGRSARKVVVRVPVGTLATAPVAGSYLTPTGLAAEKASRNRDTRVVLSL